MLTAKQKKLFDFIEAELSEKGISPSYDEMAVALELKSKSGVHRLVKALEQRGYIRQIPNHARSIVLVPEYARFRVAFETPRKQPQSVTSARNDYFMDRFTKVI